MVAVIMAEEMAAAAGGVDASLQVSKDILKRYIRFGYPTQSFESPLSLPCRLESLLELLSFIVSTQQVMQHGVLFQH